MRRITIWTIESNYDREAVKHLAFKLAAYMEIKITTVRAVGKKTFSDVTKAIKRNPDALQKAVKNYLEDDDCVIFVVDSDSPIRLEQKRGDANSAISQIERVRDKFEGRVHLALAVHELEAWLLVDCVGICCFFAGTGNSSESRQKQKKRFQSLLKNVPGNTELLVEAEAGGKGAKEYLIKFSEKVLKAIDPKVRPRALNRKKYRESLSPAVAEYVEINNETLKRNASLQRFGKFLVQCGATE